MWSRQQSDCSMGSSEMVMADGPVANVSKDILEAFDTLSTHYREWNLCDGEGRVMVYHNRNHWTPRRQATQHPQQQHPQQQQQRQMRVDHYIDQSQEPAPSQQQQEQQQQQQDHFVGMEIKDEYGLDAEAEDQDLYDASGNWIWREQCQAEPQTPATSSTAAPTSAAATPQAGPSAPGTAASGSTLASLTTKDAHVPSTPQRPVPSVEERLSTLEERFNGLEAKVDKILNAVSQW